MKLLGFDISRVSKAVPGIAKTWTDLTSTWYKPNWWQLGQSKPDANVALRSSTVYACVAVLSQEIARLRVTHFTNPELTGEIEMYKSGVTRLLTKPNSYQTRSDYFLSIMYALLMHGNSYSLATRDRRGRVIDLTPLNSNAVMPYVDPDSGDIYYSITVLDIDPGKKINPSDFIPQRNMLHIRVFTPTHPLVGVSPLVACNTSVAHGMSIQSEATRFFDNESKPAGILRTPKPLNETQAKRLREAWATGTSGINTGKVPVLDNDLQFQQMSLSAVDAQLIEQYSMTKKDIAMAYRIPLYMIGEGDSQFNNAEASQRDFVTRSLGFYIEHIEANLDDFFGFDGRTESIEFDVEGGIMRPEYNARIEGLTKGVQGGIFSPNEARHSEGKKSKDGGDDLFMQRQMVPLNLLGLDVLALGAGASNDESAEETDDNTEEDTDEKSFDNELFIEYLNERVKV